MARFAALAVPEALREVWAERVAWEGLQTSGVAP